MSASTFFYRILPLYFWYLFTCTTVLYAHQHTAHYHEQNGLLSDFTYSGIFDRNNYLWICSSRGLSRFNGTAFNHFTVREGLPDNDVVDVKEDESGVIWATPFQREAAFLEPGKTLFTNINTIIHPDTVRKDGAYALFLLKKNTVAFATRKVIRLVRDKRWIRSIQLSPGAFTDISVLFENDKEGLVLFSPGKILLLHPSGGLDSFLQAHPFDWKEWEGPLLWLRCANHSMVCIDTRKGTLGTVVHNFKCRDSIYRFGMWNDSLLLSTKGGKMITVDRSGRGSSAGGKRILLSTATQSKDKKVKAMFTRDKGIYVQVESDTGLYRELPAAPYSLLRRGNEIEVLDARNCWIFPGRFKGVQLPRYANNVGVEFSEINAGQIWIYGNNIALRGDHGYTRTLDTIANIKDVSISNDSIRYVATQLGAFMVNIRRLTQHRLYKPRTCSVSEGGNGSVFIGTYHGLQQWLPDGQLINWSDAGLPDIRVTDLAFTNGVLWIATGGRGLWAIRHNTLYHVLDENTGLVSDAIEAIAADGSNHVVLGYATGVQRVAYGLQKENIRITELLTLHTAGGEGIKYLYYLAGKVYGMGRRGLLTVPERLQEPVKDFHIQIDRVLVNGTPTELKKVYKLPTGSHDFSVSFSTVNYQQFPIRYRYRNNNEAWTYTSEPEISYHRLGAGDYRIEIQVLNNYAKPSSELVLQIEVQYPFYRRTSIIIGVLAGSFILLVVFVRIWYRQKYRKAQKALHQETRLRELELAALKAQINPHFVFNCLNSIKALIYQHQLEEADLYMDHFARLFRSTLEGAALPYHSLSSEIAFIDAYLSLEQVNVNNRFGFELVLQQHLDPDTIMIPPMLLQPYVENAVKHGVSRLKDRKGWIRVCFEQEKDLLICLISDNGPGWKGKSGQRGNGKGMKITEKRAQLYNIHTEIANNTPCGTLVRLTLSIKHSPTDDQSVYS